MANITDYQSECYRIVTIGYLRPFVNGIVDVSDEYDDSYCPTFSELTGGTIVKNRITRTPVNNDVDGIIVNGCSYMDDEDYADNQLVNQFDVLLGYTIFDNITISAQSTSVTACQTTVPLSATASFTRYTKRMVSDGCLIESLQGSVTGSEITFSAGEGGTISGNDVIISSNPTQSQRTITVTASTSFRGSNYTSTVSITQEAGPCGGCIVDSTTYTCSELTIPCESAETISTSVTYTAVTTYTNCQSTTTTGTKQITLNNIECNSGSSRILSAGTTAHTLSEAIPKIVQDGGCICTYCFCTNIDIKNIDYLRFTPTNAMTNFSFSYYDLSNINYSLDNGNTWQVLDNNSGVNVGVGQTILWKAQGSNVTLGQFISNNEFSVKGNVMSLIYGDNYEGKTSLNGCKLSGLFKGSYVADASEMSLPATVMTESCYSSMFSGCTSLVKAPSLPATTLAKSCYAGMFYGCTSLTTTPELPATTLADACYINMFRKCTILTIAPELPATTLAKSCYAGMFYGCTSLTTAPRLPATTLAESCYTGMFYLCTNLTTAPRLPATTLAEFCYSSMFNSCTSLTIAPELPATTLVNSCYHQMFDGCENLEEAHELPATSLADSCYYLMFHNTSITVAPELPATTLYQYCYYGMFYGCTKLKSVTCLATNISASRCTENWLKDVSGSGTFTKDSNMTNWQSGDSGIPSGWTVNNKES